MATSPADLWDQAYREKFAAGGGPAVRDRFRELMREHGHLVPAKLGEDRNLPCGWPGDRRGD